LKDLCELKHEFVCVVLAIHESVPDVRLSAIAHAGSMVCDDYQASTFRFFRISRASWLKRADILIPLGVALLGSKRGGQPVGVTLVGDTDDQLRA
jgi:hypothetical protein